MRAHTTVDEAAPLQWVSVASLPEALRCEVSVELTLQPLHAARLHEDHGGSWRVFGAAMGLSISAMHARDLAAAGAGVPSWVSSACAALAVALLLVPTVMLARSRGYGPRRAGSAGALLSTTALVLVERADVAAVPLEHLSRDGDVIVHRGQRMKLLGADEAWWRAFDAGVLRARSDLDARLGDPWRALRPLAAETSRARAQAAVVAGLIVAAVVVAVVVVGQRTREGGAPTQSAQPGDLRDETRAARDLAGAQRAQAAWEHARYVAAREGTEAAMREYLRAPATDLEAWRDIERRLDARCDARLPLDDVAEDLRFYRALQRSRCKNPEDALRYRADVELVTPDTGGAWQEHMCGHAVAENMLRERLASVFARLGDHDPVRLRCGAGGVFMFLRFHAGQFYFHHRETLLPTEEQLDLDVSEPRFRPRVFRYSMPWRETPVAERLIESMPDLVRGR